MSSDVSIGQVGKTVKSTVFVETTPAESEEEKRTPLKERLTKKKPKLSDNARVVLEKRYLKKDDNGVVVEQPEDMFYRVAETIAAAEKLFVPDANTDIWTEKFYTVMTDLDFLPNSPTLMNAGRELGQLSACFVLPVGDSMEEIFESVKYTALIHKSGGGTGFSQAVRCRLCGSLT
jgi:ribonucleoside-diphosphate reductase alpha chain